MRLLLLSSLVGAVGLWGVALAQPLVIDPWERPSRAAESSSWFSEPPAETLVPAVGPDTPAFEREAPLSRSENRGVMRPGAGSSAPFEPRAGDIVVDPWARGEARIAASTMRGGSPGAPWAARVTEVVDPWRRDVSAAPDTSLRLIVDPWAR